MSNRKLCYFYDDSVCKYRHKPFCCTGHELHFSFNNEIITCSALIETTIEMFESGETDLLDERLTDGSTWVRLITQHTLKQLEKINESSKEE